MKLSLFPQDTKSLELLAQTAAELMAGVKTLSEILGAPADDYDKLSEELHDRDSNVSRLLFALLTNLRTSFVNPLPREDMFQLSLHLVNTFEHLDATAELIALNRVKRLSARASEQLEVIGRMSEMTREAMPRLNSLEDLDEYCIEMIRLAKRAERTHRVWVSELLSDHKGATLARHRDVADQLVAATKTLRQASHHVGQILVKES
jgi:uncharacterized protein